MIISELTNFVKNLANLVDLTKEKREKKSAS